MVDLVELIFAEDNETVLRKDNKQKVDARPLGEPDCIGFYKYRCSSEGDIHGYIEREIISRGASIGATAYVKGGKEMWRVQSYGDVSYYWRPIQYYKMIDTNEK